ncbi:RidA family protein [Arthrobacter cavernae]|uniref:RidA family protein n=2 Tax=Arthrobacter TaxID=1663 RepID=A0A939KM92_9MICC|nr:RidA family protein [Arthrobacter cavernae]MBO1266430.1 RidA family protein [Arthrobacter cavernae]
MRKTFGSGSVWEQTLGYSRAVQVDNTLFISATAASGPDGIVGDDFYSQTKYILEKLGAVLEEAGFSYEDVVQSKLYLTDISKWEDAGRAHGEVFGDIRPTLALVHVLPFLDQEMLVEIELVAQKSA